jgi:pyridoxamine 5'-phosphate oxidase
MSLEETRSYMNQVRRDFSDRPLTEESVDDNPFTQYAVWFEEAVNSEILDPFAMCLSTVGLNGQPSSRIVYMRDILEEGFVFYTNYLSQKGKELLSTPKAALNLHWSELDRQIRIEGDVIKVSDETSDKYFAARPKKSQIGAWASAQSDVLTTREELEQHVLKYTARFKDIEVDRPKHWGGYVLKPTKIEFWQGRASRLHDRIVYTKEGVEWKLRRLSP